MENVKIVIRDLSIVNHAIDGKITHQVKNARSAIYTTHDIIKK